MEKMPKHIDANIELPQEVINDCFESILDSFLDDGIFKEIPVIKTIISLYKTGKSIKDYYTTRKIYAFLTGCKDISPEKTRRFIDSLKDEETREDIGMRVLMIVDKVDDVKKAELIGRALMLLIYNQIDFPFYSRLCHMIEKCLYCDILELKKFKDERDVIITNNKLMDSIVLESLFSSGLISECGIDGGNTWGENSGTRYKLNEYSVQLRKVL